MIIVVASITTKPGKRAEFLDIFKANATKVREEDGCIEYLPTIDADSNLTMQLVDAQVVTIVEKWRDLDALRAHLRAPHMLEYFQKVEHLTDGTLLKLLREA
jgi:quinol monooxygenase YgiN